MPRGVDRVIGTGLDPRRHCSNVPMMGLVAGVAIMLSSCEFEALEKTPWVMVSVKGGAGRSCRPR
jgi:hypothetical protein